MAVKKKKKLKLNHVLNESWLHEYNIRVKKQWDDY